MHPIALQRDRSPSSADRSPDALQDPGGEKDASEAGHDQQHSSLTGESLPQAVGGPNSDADKACHAALPLSNVLQALEETFLRMNTGVFPRNPTVSASTCIP